MSLSTRIYVGVDCDPAQLMLGIIGADGILRGLSTTRSPLADEWDSFGQRIFGMVRGLRGEQNLRMKQFQGIGIGLPAGAVTAHGQSIVSQLAQVCDIPARVADREALSAAGTAW